jgi:murein L,D-transpeptidase YcbB/YkuD
MKRILVISLFLINCLLIVGFPTATKANSNSNAYAVKTYQKIPSFPPTPFDSTLIAPFFAKYPKLKSLKPEVVQLYKKHNYQFLWYDGSGMNEFAALLYDKVNNLEQEGLRIRVPYTEKIQSIFQDMEIMEKSEVEVELIMSSLYFFYADRVFKGLDAKKTIELGWYLPRKKQSYVNRLDSLLQDPNLINKQPEGLPRQYYLLKRTLQKYRDISEKGGWDSIILPKKIKSLRPGDTSGVILQIRKRLFITGDLIIDSRENIFDDELLEGVLKYKERNAFTPNSLLLPQHIEKMNIMVEERIKTIMVNMERSRWLSQDYTKAEQSIVVNIPSFTLTYFKKSKPVLVSRVVVGKSMNKTAVFSGQMNQIIFSPYWNVPSSILRKEILPAIAKNSNYLAKHNMEWVGGRVRQRPGPQNALGKVKFIFPNSHIIFMHDTPSKSLFDREQRAFSHGCIRLARPRDLAIEILKDDKNWTVEKIDTAMNRRVERTYNLKTKIPVYIGYFTAWVDSTGQIHFYADVYGRDKRLSKILLSEL